MFCVEMLSSLPNSQADGSDLAGQGQTSHLWLHPFTQQTDIEILERAGITTGPAGRTFEYVFQIMIVVGFGARELNCFFATLELPFPVAVLPPIGGLDP